MPEELVEVEIPKGLLRRLVFGLLQRFVELAV
jgi:hypothetical protein